MSSVRKTSGWSDSNVRGGVQQAKRPNTRTKPMEDYWDLVADYESYLRAKPSSPESIRTYNASHKDFTGYLAREGIPLVVADITRQHLEHYLDDLMNARHRSVGTAITHYKGLHAFFNWLVNVDELAVSPMFKMHTPRGPDKAPHILADEQIIALLRACRGHDYFSRRDFAMIRVLLDTGIRRGELVSMRYDPDDPTWLDLDHGLALVRGKNRGRIGDLEISFNARTEEALRSFIRARRKFWADREPNLAERPELWLSNYGPLRADSVRNIILRRARQAGIGHIHPHLFRHAFVHDGLSNGLLEGEVAELLGITPGVLGRYGRKGRHDRAIAAHKRLRRGDRV